MLEGTAANIEKLKKGGHFEIDALVNIRSSTYQSSQLDAMLQNGTEEQKRQAVMQITGATEVQYMNNQDYWTQRAKADREIARADIAKTRAQERASATDKEAFDADMLAAGYEWVPGVDFTLPEGYELRSNGAETLVYKKGSSTADYGLTEAYQNRREGYYKDIGAPDIDAINSLLTESETYTEGETRKFLDQIINGTLQYSNETAGKYMAAYNMGGTYTKEYIKRKARGEAISPELETAFNNERRNEPTFTAEDYDLSTAGGALKYQQLNYGQSNKAALAANKVYQTLASGKINSVADLAESVNDSDVDNWAELLSSSDDLRKTFEDLGIKVGEDGKTLDFSDVEDSADGLASALAVLSQIIGGISDEYNRKPETYSTGETYQYATDLLNGTIAKADVEKGYNALAEVTGNQDFANYVANKYADWTAQSDAYAEYNAITDRRGKSAWRAAHGGIPTDPGEFNPYEGIKSSLDLDYATALFQNASDGISGLTDVQRYDKIQEMMAIAQGSDRMALTNLRNNDTFGAFNEYMNLSGLEGAQQWFQLAERLNEQGLNIKDLQSITPESADYDKYQQAVKGIYENVSKAQEADRNYRNSVKTTGEQLKKNSGFSDAYTTGLKKQSCYGYRRL